MSTHHSNDARRGVFNPQKRKTNSRGSILDDLIGLQIRKAREELNLKLGRLSKMIGVSYQQVQKYETGENRISASTLLIVSMKTGKPMEFFVKTARAYLDEGR